MQEHRPQLAWPTESRGAAGWQECVKQEARWCGSDHFFHPLRIGRNGRRSHPFQAVTSLKMDSSSVAYDFLPDCSCGAKRPTPDLRLSVTPPVPRLYSLSPPRTAHCYFPEIKPYGGEGRGGGGRGAIYTPTTDLPPRAHSAHSARSWSSVPVAVARTHARSCTARQTSCAHALPLPPSTRTKHSPQ